MKITIEGMQPDGLSVMVENLCFDTMDEVMVFLKKLDEIYNR